MTTQHTITRGPEEDLAELVDTVEELGALATGSQPLAQALELLARRCRHVLGADVVLIALRRGGSAEVVFDADPDLDPTELARQQVLAEASLDDPVIDGRPGLPHPGGEAGPVVSAGHQHLRRLVTELPRRGSVRGTLTIGRRPPFADDEAELAMAFASLAELVVGQEPMVHLGVPSGDTGGSDVVRRLFSVGLALHLALRSTGDPALRHVVEEAIAQLDQAVLDVRQASFTSRQV